MVDKQQHSASSSLGKISINPNPFSSVSQTSTQSEPKIAFPSLLNSLKRQRSFSIDHEIEEKYENAKKKAKEDYNERDHRINIRRQNARKMKEYLPYGIENREHLAKLYNTASENTIQTANSQKLLSVLYRHQHPELSEILHKVATNKKKDYEEASKEFINATGNAGAKNFLRSKMKKSKQYKDLKMKHENEETNIRKWEVRYRDSAFHPIKKIEKDHQLYFHQKRLHEFKQGIEQREHNVPPEKKRKTS